MSVEENTKTKVVWLCHFSNQEIVNYFQTKKNNDFAPWINQLISIFENNSSFEVHIIAPNYFINEATTFLKNNIRYNFYKSNYPFINQKYINLNFFWFAKRNVQKLVSEIKPDIIHLHGAENAYYSSTILQFFKKYPVLVTIQGFVHKSSKKKWPYEFVRKRRIKIENKVLQKATNFGIRAKFMESAIKEYNKNAKFHWHNYPINKPNLSENSDCIDKEFDCVFFARITKDKGIEDLLEAISIVKKTKNDISLLVLGGANDVYLEYLKQMCVRLKIVDNVHFIGFLPQEVLFKEATKARISILPTHHDIIPGTVIESMFLKIPVISYNVDGLPDINEDENNIILLPKGDIKGLSENILELLGNKELRNSYATKAYIKANTMFDNNKILPSLVNIYQKIITNFRT
ncbi:MAG: glycosyltransferase family 4 protein [Arcobacter sp.]|nr:glycosyltransferase family 4 protein [Arcobacter sp.]